jgi:hypothetical protein
MSFDPLTESRMWRMSGVPYFFPFCRGVPHATVAHGEHPRGWTCDCPCHDGLNRQWWSELRSSDG